MNEKSNVPLSIIRLNEVTESNANLMKQANLSNRISKILLNGMKKIQFNSLVQIPLARIRLE